MAFSNDSIPPHLYASIDWLREVAKLPGRGPMLTALMLLAKGTQIGNFALVPVTDADLDDFEIPASSARRCLKLLKDHELIDQCHVRGEPPVYKIEL